MTRILLVVAIASGCFLETSRTFAQKDAGASRYTNHLIQESAPPRWNGPGSFGTNSFQTANQSTQPPRFENRTTSYDTDENSGLPLDWKRQAQRQPSSNSGAAVPASAAQAFPMKNVSYNLPAAPVQDNQGYSSDYGQTVTKDGYRISPCTVEFIDDIELPALESGQIAELLVKEGDLVRAGSKVGQLDDQLYQRMKEQASLRLDIAVQNAEDETSVSAAYNEIELAGIELKRMTNLASKGSRALSDKEKAEFEFKLAMLKKQAAENQQKSAMGESRVERSKLNEAMDRIQRHELKSTSEFDTNVIEIFRDPLEWVNAGEPVMRLGRMDRLWVSGVIDTDDFNAHEVINKPVTVTLQLARGEETKFKGKIVHVALERQHSDKLMVRAEIENRRIDGDGLESQWVLQPNSTVEMTIHVQAGQAAAVDANPSTTAEAGQFPVQNR